MKARNTLCGMGVFFMVVVTVCNGPAIAQSSGESVNPGEPIEVFSSDESVLPQGQTVQLGDFGQIELHVKDLDLTKVLQLLSIQSEKNIIASRNVAGAVSADLYGVDFYEALAAILHPNGFGFKEEGQFIYVYTADELAAIEKENKQTVHKIVRLSYISGADAATFITPLLSSAGSVAVSADASADFQASVSDGGANTFAHADTLLITDYPENVDQILEILKELDIRPRQVLVEATILQSRLTDATAFGVDFALFADLELLNFATPLGAFDELIKNATVGGAVDSGSALVSSPGKVDSGAATLKFGILGDDVSVFVRALDEVSDVSIIASPRILMLNRQKADLLIGDRLGYISTNASSTSTTQTVEFLDIGTQLTIRPFIGEDDFIRLELRSSVSSGTTSLVGGFVIPNTSTNDLQTNVMIKSGHTVVLGGLFKEDTTIDRSQVPGIGGIPLLGNAFKGQDDKVTRSEVIFLLKPTIMRDKYLYEMADGVMGDSELNSIGIREGLLPWSRTKMVNWQMREAQEYFDAGDLDKAKWHSDLALSMDPTVVAARSMREEITGERGYLHNFSILKNVMDEAVQKQMIGDAKKASDAAASESAESQVEASEPADQQELAEADEPADEASVEAQTQAAAATEAFDDQDGFEIEQAANDAEAADTTDATDASQAEASSSDLWDKDAPAAEAQDDAQASSDNETATAEADADMTGDADTDDDYFFSDADGEEVADESQDSDDQSQVDASDVVEAWTADESADGETVGQVSEVETPVE